MDVNILRSIVTVLSLGVFAGICAWAWARRNQAQFDEAAQIPFLNHEGAHDE
ncbi:MAG: cbb3-type cytochrome c oxidase subunit 3 [Rhizobacter sp.]